MIHACELTSINFLIKFAIPTISVGHSRGDMTFINPYFTFTVGAVSF